MADVGAPPVARVAVTVVAFVSATRPKSVASPAECSVPRKSISDFAVLTEVIVAVFDVSEPVIAIVPRWMFLIKPLGTRAITIQPFC